MPLASSEIKVDMTGTLLSFSLPLSLSRIKISAATTIANIITGMSIPNTTHNFDFCSLFSFTIFSPVLSLLLELKHCNLIHKCHFLFLHVFFLFFVFFYHIFICFVFAFGIEALKSHPLMPFPFFEGVPFVLVLAMLLIFLFF